MAGRARRRRRCEENGPCNPEPGARSPVHRLCSAPNRRYPHAPPINLARRRIIGRRDSAGEKQCAELITAGNGGCGAAPAPVPTR